MTLPPPSSHTRGEPSAIVRRYGMEERIVGFGVSGFDLPDLTAHREEVITNFVNEAKRLIDAGAEVIIPMGIRQ